MVLTGRAAGSAASGYKVRASPSRSILERDHRSQPATGGRVTRWTCASARLLRLV